MASGLYKAGLFGLMNKTIDLDTDTIKVRATSDVDYAAPADFSTATVMTGITGYAGTTDQTLTVDITTTKGTMDATDLAPAFTALAQDAAKVINGLVIYQFVTTDADSIPIAYIDLTTPVTPNGGDINITWNASGIFSL